MKTAPIDATNVLARVMRWSEEGADWVFAYGSLIWDPVGTWTRRERATLHGYHRRFCIGSRLYRGTPEKPGALLGLVPGGSCNGIAYELDRHGRAAVLASLVRREMPDGTPAIYRPARCLVRLHSGERVQALLFVADRQSVHFELLGDEEAALRIRHARGRLGTNLEYAQRTAEALRAERIRDSTIARVMGLAKRDLAAPRGRGVAGNQSTMSAE